MSNIFVKDLGKIKVTIKKPVLEKILESKGMNTPKIWDKIRKNDDSVQNLEGLADH